MSFSLPIRSRPVDDLLSCIELWFDDKYQADDENWPSARFLVRGGVCWPDRYDPLTDSVRGVALMCGYNLSTDVAYVFEEQSFVCIDHVLNPATRAIEFQGLAPWFNAVYSRCLGDTFYVSQPDPVRDRWEREVGHTPAVQNNPPRFVPCPEWRDVAAGENIIWEWITRKRIKFFAGDQVEVSIRAHRKGEEKVLPPAMHALACCLSGMSTQIEQAREVARSPQSLIGKVKNKMMLDNPRDWRGNT
jgi:hypothetical protein